MSGKDKYTNSAPPLGFDQAWINNQLKNGSGVDLLTAQILSQKTYDKWTGQGFGSVLENARSMARRLSNAGISRLEDFGQRNVTSYETQWVGYGDNGEYQSVPVTRQEFYNKATGAKVAGDVQSGNMFDKTYAGDGSTTFNVQFNSMGMPIFFSQYGGSSSDWGAISGLLSVASFIPGVGPFAAALNAVGNAYNGNTTGAVLSALSAAGQFGAQYGTIDPSSANAINGMDAASDAAVGATASVGTSVANFFAQNAGVIQTAQQGVAVLNALDKGNLAGVISGLTNIAPQVGITIPSEIIKPISAAATAAAIGKGDWAGAMAAAGTLADNPALRQDAKLASQAVSVVRAIQSGNPAAILSAGMGFAKQSDLGKSTFKTLASSFGVQLDDKDLVAFENAPPDSAAFDAATKGLVKLYDDTVSEAKSEYKELTGKDMSDSELDVLQKSGDIAGSMDRLTSALEGADEETKKQAMEQLGQGVDKAVEFASDFRETSVEEARSIMKDLGYENPTDDEVQQFAGQMSESASKTSAQAYVDQHSVSEDEARKYLTDLGYNPTDDEVKQFAKQGADVMQSDIESQLGEYAGEHTIDRAEAEKFFQDLGYTPSEEELQQFMRQGADITGETVSGELGQYVDANQITEDEARDIYAQLGLKNPTQEDIEKLMGQYAESELGTRAEENLDAARYNSLYEMIQDAGARAADDQTQSQLDDLGGQITDVQSSLEEQIAGQGEQFQTLLQQYEDLGMSRDEALQQAMTDMQSTLGEQITGQGEQFQTLLQQYEDLGLSRDEALQQAMTDMQGTLGEQIAANQDATQAGFAELENKFKTMYDESNTDTQAKFDELTDSQKALAASLAASTGDLQAAIDEAAQNTTDMFANLQDTFGGQLQDFQTTVDQRMQELQDQGLTYQQALDTVNGELGQMREDFGIQLGGTEEKLGKQIEQQGVSFGNLFSNWQKTYQDQAAKDAAARAAQDAANAKAAAAQNAATQAQIKQQGDQQSLMNMLMLAGLSDAQSGQQAQQPVQTPVADVKSFEELGFGDIFGTSLGFSAGGDVDDLLNILRG